MKHLYLLALIFSAHIAFAQNKMQPELASIAQNGPAPGWIKFKPSVNVSASTLFEDHASAFGLGGNDRMQVYRTVSDKLGFTHYRVQQYYKQVKVEGAEYLLHEKEGKLVSANGRTVAGLDMNVTPSLSGEQAVQKALSFVNATKYMWDDPGAEATLKRVKKNSNATFYPQPELVLVDRSFSGNAKSYRLAYKMIIMCEEPVGRWLAYIDANTGEMYHLLNLLHTTNNTTGTAATKYSGTQTIITDSLGLNAYRMVETTRGSGIETYDMNTGTAYGAAVDFVDSDNYWNNVNAQQDEAATDVHFAAEMTYDYYLGKYGYDSYDGQGSVLINYVHYDVNYVNAFWNGSWMTYGDGNGTTYTALTSLDVGGHEITHGVTESLANLIYQNESGALNESFSDIFGTAVEYFANPSSFDWLIGEDFSSNGLGFRNMANPNAMGDPGTYGGNNWYVGTNDNGGVHTNSGVQNHWFYLLSAGGTGTNDLGNNYTVTGLGIDTAAAIVFRSLSTYITQTSVYADAREASIQAAEDIYGACSNAVIQVANAWYAVGVGNPISDYDLRGLMITSPGSGCGLSANENISVRLRYNGCSQPLSAGDSIPVAYKVDNNTVVNDTIVLASQVVGGDTIAFTFAVPANVSALGYHNIAVWSDLSNDPLHNNDTARVTIENRVQQNIDVGVTEIVSPVSACQLTNAEQVKVRVRFYGCDSLSAGDSIVLAYKLDNNAPVFDTLVLDSALYPWQTVVHTFSTPGNFSAFGSHMLASWTAFNVDTLNSNDSLVNMRVKNPYEVQNQVVTFESPVFVLDSMRLITNSESGISVAPFAAHTGTKGLCMTGGDPINYSGEIVLPDGTNNWLVNEDFSAKACFCVDATGWQTANLRFDLKQTFSSIYMLYAGMDFPDASSFRILVNNTQIGGTYNPATYNSDPYLTRFINLDAYAGTQFEVCFETRNGFNDPADPIGIGDNAYIDNVYFSEQSTIGISEQHASSFMQVYPNPNAGAFTVAYNSTRNEEVVIDAVDVLGRTISTMKKDAAAGSNFYDLSLSGSKGIYFVRIKSSKEIITQRIIIE